VSKGAGTLRNVARQIRNTHDVATQELVDGGVVLRTAADLCQPRLVQRSLQSGDFDADGIGSAVPSAVVRTAGDG
jgi:hypothetical protein